MSFAFRCCKQWPKLAKSNYLQATGRGALVVACFYQAAPAGARFTVDRVYCEVTEPGGKTWVQPTPKQSSKDSYSGKIRSHPADYAAGKEHMAVQGNPRQQQVLHKLHSLCPRRCIVYSCARLSPLEVIKQHHENRGLCLPTDERSRV